MEHRKVSQNGSYTITSIPSFSFVSFLSYYRVFYLTIVVKETIMSLIEICVKKEGMRISERKEADLGRKRRFQRRDMF